MPKRVTIAVVAELAGVHKATVSRALNSQTEHQVNPDTTRRIHSAAKKLGYIPNIVARGLRTSLSMTVGIVVPDLTNPVFHRSFEASKTTSRLADTPRCSPIPMVGTRWNAPPSILCSSGE